MSMLGGGCCRVANAQGEPREDIQGKRDVPPATHSHQPEEAFVVAPTSLLARHHPVGSVRELRRWLRGRTTIRVHAVLLLDDAGPGRARHSATL